MVARRHAVAAGPPPGHARLLYNGSVVWIRQWLALGLALGLVACGDDGGGGQDSDNASSTGTADTGPTTDPTGTQDDTDGCVAGTEACSCLNGGCAGQLQCVENICVAGPLIEIDQAPSVVPGLVVPLEAEVEAESYSWSQEGGPAVEILGGDTLNIEVVIPPDTEGETVTLRLSAMRNDVTDSRDVSIEIIDAAFEDALPEIADPTQLGTPQGLAFGPPGMWIVSSEGFVSVFDEDDGTFIERHDVPGMPMGANFDGENLIIANRDGMGRVDRLNSVSGSLSLHFDMAGVSPLGAVTFPLVEDSGDDADGNVWLSVAVDQRVLFYNAEAGQASMFIEGLGEANAIAFGPENNAVYVGTAGHVWRIPFAEGGVAGEAEDYLTVGSDVDNTYEVMGLVFDEGNNLWIGCPNASTLYVAPYAGAGPTEVANSWSDVGSVSRFSNLAFRDDVLYYTNPDDGTVGRVRTGLGRLNTPLGD